ncbi:hypothetical protein HD806DRAFT_532276 [Xylariaceae sp. AK1471]|nr:hypothetical protein HD806DRAFT_532276 [Xylariaceae sp. AK1471]
MSSTKHTPEQSQLPYWQVNVPPDKRTEQCPDFLLDLSDKDLRVLSTRDEDYQRISWEQVGQIITQNDLGSFSRVPSDLRRYLEFKYNIENKFGSMLDYVLQKRLQWPSIVPSGDTPFSNTSDYKILWNDWPYGIDKEITHLVVWTKFWMDAATDDISPYIHAAIESFVVHVFCDTESGGLDRSRVIWFKNWTSLKSVGGIEHFHVMLYKANEDFINRITRGERPLAEKAQEAGNSILDLV